MHAGADDGTGTGQGGFNGRVFPLRFDGEAVGQDLAAIVCAFFHQPVVEQAMELGQGFVAISQRGVFGGGNGQAVAAEIIEPILIPEVEPVVRKRRAFLPSTATSFHAVA